MGARADIRTQSGNDFGKPGTTFPWGDLSYPQIVLEIDVRSNQDKKAFLSAYDGADAAQWTNMKLTGVSSGTPGTNQQNDVRYRWERLPGVELIRKGYDLDTGAPTRVVRQRVALPATPIALGASRTFDTIVMYAQDCYIEPESVVVGTLVTVYQQLPTSILVVYDQDPETLVTVVTSYQVVAMPVTPPTPTVGIIISYQKIDSVKALKITRDFTAFLAYTYDEQRFSADTFPSLFDYLTYLYIDGCGAFSTIRASFSTKVKTRITITFDNAVQDIDGLVLIPQTFQLGIGVQIHSDVLVDAGSFTFTGVCTYTVDFLPSDPTYSEYLALIGTEQLVAGESVLFKARIYRTMKVYETML